MSTLVCITGMHRSGTSMVARALSAAGLWLGPQERLMPPQADNPLGFFENLDFVRLADELLDRLGGAWDRPPARLIDADLPAIEGLTARGDSLLAGLVAGSPSGSAGWKDPRASLLLPFWRRLRPDLRVVVCLRDPLSVARSLRERHRVSLRFGVDLWQAYNAQLLDEVAAGRTVLTHYDAWIAEPRSELRRVAEAVGLPVEAAAAGKIADSLRADARAPAAPASSDELLGLAGLQCVRLYDALRARAGAVPAHAAGGRVQPAPGDADPSPGAAPRADAELLLLRQRILELDAQRARPLSGPAPYRVGTPIDARKGGNAPLYLGAGWAEPQDAGTWSVGARASVHLALHALTPGSGATLQVRLRPLVGPRHAALTCRLFINEAEIAAWTLTDARATTLECPLDPRHLQAAPALRLDFVIDTARSPSEVGLSADARPLGILLQSLRLGAAAPPAGAAPSPG